MTARFLFWLLLAAGLLPPVMTAWVSFSPDSLLTPPTGEWSLRWYRRFFSDARWTAAAGRSLLVAALSAILCVTLALPAALAQSAPRWQRLALLLPAFVPPVAVGLGLLPLFHRLNLWGTTLGVTLAHAALGLPVAYLILRTAVGPELRDCELAARGLGANRRQVFARVTLPLLRPALLAALLAQFVLSWNEGVVTTFLASPRSETLPVVMWSQLRGSASPLVAVASTLAVAMAVLPLLAVSFRSHLARPNEVTR